MALNELSLEQQQVVHKVMCRHEMCITGISDIPFSKARIVYVDTAPDQTSSYENGVVFIYNVESGSCFINSTYFGKTAYNIAIDSLKRCGVVPYGAFGKMIHLIYTFLETGNSKEIAERLGKVYDV
jgi:hypothetical protein